MTHVPYSKTSVKFEQSHAKKTLLTLVCQVDLYSSLNFIHLLSLQILCIKSHSYRDSYWLFCNVERLSSLCRCVGTQPVSVTFSSARWDCGCLSGYLLTLPDRACTQRDSCVSDRSEHSLSCFHRGHKGGTQILMYCTPAGVQLSQSGDCSARWPLLTFSYYVKSKCSHTDELNKLDFFFTVGVIKWYCS